MLPFAIPQLVRRLRRRGSCRNHAQDATNWRKSQPETRVFWLTLIMALIVTARDFIGIDGAKVIIALRRDLMDRVFRIARDSGFQEEKYRSLYLPLTWSKDDILTVLDKRISHLVARRYTKATVGYREVFPRRFRGVPIGDYIYGIATRPRDIIAFFNTCMEIPPRSVNLTAAELKIAEGEYSRSRLRAVADEWSADYPALVEFSQILQRRPTSFKRA